MTEPSRTPPQGGASRTGSADRVARSPVVTAAIVLVAAVLGGIAFWSRRPSGELRPWTPADHDQPASNAGAPPPSGAARKPRPSSGTDLVELAWERNCASCHGARGQGDGPQGPMVRAPDLTRADWQDRVTDDDLAQTITKGRNKMPAFDLPPAVVQGLVKRIRQNRARP